MPVFTRFRDGVLILTADGDFTGNEIRRVAYGAFHEDEMPEVVPVLLDMSGAAGITGKSTEDLQSLGAIFGAHRDRISGLAVVTPSNLHPIFARGGHFAQEADVPVSAHSAHADARRWLAEQHDARS